MRAARGCFQLAWDGMGAYPLCGVERSGSTASGSHTLHYAQRLPTPPAAIYRARARAHDRLVEIPAGARAARGGSEPRA